MGQGAQEGRAARALRTVILVAAVLVVAFLAGTGAATLAERAGLWGAEAPAVEQPTDEAPDATPTDAAADSYVAPSVSSTAWDEAESPNYYRVVGTAQVGEQPAAGTIAYGPLDQYGRATGVVAAVTYESMEAGRSRARGDLQDLEPSGWGHNDEVDMAMPDGTIYHGQFFNRSHLVAKSLGGDDGLHNLITGTRTQNVGANIDGSEGGMAYAEGLVRAWLARHHDGWVYYAVTPAYTGDELVARSVIVDVRSSDGELDQRVEVYNAARGFSIDYATGFFEVTEDAASVAADISARLGVAAPTSDSADDADDSNTVTLTGTSESEDGERKVIITGSGEAYHHDETCKGLENARSMEWVTVSEAEEMGRHPCGICGG